MKGMEDMGMKGIEDMGMEDMGMEDMALRTLRYILTRISTWSNDRVWLNC